MRRRATPVGGGPTSRHQLRSLRLRLAVLYAIISALALGSLGAFVLAADGGLRSHALDADLRLQAAKAVRSVWFESDGTFHDEGVSRDQSLVGGYPQVYVLRRVGATGEGEPTFDTAVSPRTPYYRDASITQPANDAIGARDESIVRERLGGRYPIRMLALPFLDQNGEAGGAIVAIADETTLLSTRSRLRLYVLLGCLGLLALSAGAGYLLAGRSLKPAALALDQQERFLADAAHEIRTPIAAIRALAEGAAAGDQSSEAALIRTAEIASHASTTVDDLLFLARADAGRTDVRREALRLDLLAEEAAEPVAGVSFDTTPVIVEGDASLLRRAIGNLVANADRHGRALDRRVPVDVIVRPGKVIVEDGGPGIEPGIAVHVYERFRSARRSGGTGLGLPIVRMIARAHGGDIELGPRPGGGVRATLSLPGAHAAEPRDPQPEPEPTQL